jgi:phosphopantothenoylcysteine decarboxylase/phosphopantothenate--cysteine ligase
MNENMYLNKITQENIKKLKRLGYKFIGPEKGRLADGNIGIGHLAGIEDIIKAVKGSLR